MEEMIGLESKAPRYRTVALGARLVGEDVSMAWVEKVDEKRVVMTDVVVVKMRIVSFNDLGGSGIGELFAAELKAGSWLKVSVEPGVFVSKVAALSEVAIAVLKVDEFLFAIVGPNGRHKVVKGCCSSLSPVSSR